MRIYLRLTPNTEIVPFNYQRALVGAFHKWLGENELHDEISLYSLSWLYGGKMRRDKKGYDFRHGAEFFISSPLEDLHKSAISGLFKDEDIQWGDARTGSEDAHHARIWRTAAVCCPEPGLYQKAAGRGQGAAICFPRGCRCECADDGYASKKAGPGWLKLQCVGSL